MLYHLRAGTRGYTIAHKFPVSENYQPSLVSLSYNQIDQRDARGVIASLVSGANGNDPDLTRHPWALHSIWMLQDQGLAVILECQHAGALPRLLS